MLKTLLTILPLMLICTAYGQTADSIPKLFKPDLISTSYPNRDIAISPDGDEIFYTLQSYKREISVIIHLTRVHGQWSQPGIASFSGQYSDLEPAFSPDGNRLYFASNRPTTENPDKNDFDIWYVDRAEEKWGTPKNIGTPVNTDGNEFYPSVTSKGSVYFTAEYKGSKGKEDIYVSHWTNGKYSPPESISEAVNTSAYEFNAYVAPDESYIIFTSYGRTEDLGGGDLYISTKNNQDQWTTARHLPAPINSTGLDYCPFVSADGQYFFFTSNRSEVKSTTEYQKIVAMLEGTKNGFDNVYWMKMESLLKK